MYITFVENGFAPDACCQLVSGRARPKWFSDHSTNCWPLLAANRIGWDVVAPCDITVSWDGTDLQHGVKITGGSFAEPHFGIGTFTVNLSHMIKTPPGYQTMVLPVPNHPQADFETMSAIIETDRLEYPFFVSIRILKTGKTVIRKGTRLARLMVADFGASVDADIFQVSNRPQAAALWHDDLRNTRTRLMRENADHPNSRSRMTGFYQSIATLKGVEMPKPIRVEDQFLQIDDFLSPDQISKIIKETEAKRGGFEWENCQDFRPQWPRLAWFPEWPADVQARFDELAQTASAAFGTELKLTDPNAVRWPKGQGMMAHSDYGAHNEFPHREWAAIVYLNDDYEGGEVFFPQLEKVIKPKAGQCMVFPGGKLMHGVHPVTAGTRYTVASWLASELPEIGK